MAVLSGTRLGPYQVESQLGAGGMGEVYRARDTRLDRTVAIKVLPSQFSQNAELRQRFEREARAISSLSHPHICTLHDIGHQEGTDYLVMEYLEGETLLERLEKGPLPTAQVLRYAVEIADALGKAHQQGIVHRDLKPGNIMLTKSGAKLLDFGLAKLKVQVAPVADALTEMTAGDRKLTEKGTLVGTFQYMAPEQLEGKEADARTDIFAFGAVVHEMTTGKPAFTGKSKASLIAAILEKDPPPISSLQPMAPPALDHVVKRCLAKDPADRWQTVHDLMHELKWIAESGSEVSIPAPVVARRKGRERSAWTLAMLMTVVAVALAVAYFRSPGSEVRSVRAFIPPPEKATFNFWGPRGGPVAVSPDGRNLAFGATAEDGKNLLWVRPLNGLAAHALPGTEGASFPFWSPDSRFIAFFANGKLKKIEASGGRALAICDAGQDSRGGTWNREGMIVFAPAPFGSLYRVPATGGVPTPVTKLDESSQTTHRWPWFLPDGRHFLYLAGSLGVSGFQDIYVASLDSKESKLLLHASSSTAYAQGHLLFLRERTLVAQPFDLKRLELVGDALPIAEEVNGWRPVRSAFFSASDNGILSYQAGGSGSVSRLAWLSREGKQISALGEQLPYFAPRLSTDGLRLAVVIEEPSVNIWLYELPRGVNTRFTTGSGPDTSPVWSPDGSRIVFASARKGPFDLYQKPASGSGNEELLLHSAASKIPTDWSADGRYIAFEQGDPKGNTRTDIWMLPMFGDRKPFPFVETQFDERGAQFSPDGRWIAYTSDESGQDEIYVAPFPGPGSKWRISTAGGEEPKWRRDGKELFFLAGDKKLMAAQVKGNGSTFEIGVVRPLFQIHGRKIGGASTVYDVSADGQRFLVNTLAEENPSPLTLVVNWTADLKK